MNYDELVAEYNKLTGRLRLYYLAYEKASDSIKHKIDKRVYKLLEDRSRIDFQIKQTKQWRSDYDSFSV